MATSTTLSDEQIAEAIKVAVRKNPERSYGSEGEFARFLKLDNTSVRRIKRVLRRLIYVHGVLWRDRAPKVNLDCHLERPITLGLLDSQVAN